MYSTPVRITVISATIGITLIGLLTAFFQRRRRRKAYVDLNGAAGDLANGKINSVAVAVHSTPSPGIRTRTRGLSPASFRNHSRSSSSSTLTTVHDLDDLSATKLCDLGLESLQRAIQFWEDALRTLDGEQESTNEMLQLNEQLHSLLERGYRMQTYYQNILCKKAANSAAVDSALAAIQQLDREYERRRRAGSSLGSRTSLEHDDDSDLDSFVSALDVADLSDLEEQKETHQHLAFYEEGLSELESGSVYCRALRTQLFNCGSDTEFLAKLHCVRLAFQDIFLDESLRKWFIDKGRSIVADILKKSNRDASEFYESYDSMVEWVSREENMPMLREELDSRGVKLLTFYDVVVDFILMDAFEDLENPPGSVTAVVKNRWLSNGFKETALSTAVWSVLKAKRRMLKFPDGFISHFYAISEYTSPVLAWGFLGPDTPLKRLCLFFKEQVLGFVQDVFSFDKVRFSTRAQLADDIVKRAKERFGLIEQKLDDVGCV